MTGNDLFLPILGLIVLGYGIWSLLRRRVNIVSRGSRIHTVTGKPATMAGLLYVAIGAVMAFASVCFSC